MTSQGCCQVKLPCSHAAGVLGRRSCCFLPGWQRKGWTPMNVMAGVSSQRTLYQRGGRFAPPQIGAQFFSVWTHLVPCVVHARLWPRPWLWSACGRHMNRSVDAMYLRLLVCMRYVKEISRLSWCDSLLADSVDSTSCFGNVPVWGAHVHDQFVLQLDSCQWSMKISPWFAAGNSCSCNFNMPFHSVLKGLFIILKHLPSNLQSCSLSCHCWPMFASCHKFIWLLLSHI